MSENEHEESGPVFGKACLRVACCVLRDSRRAHPDEFTQHATRNTLCEANATFPPARRAAFPHE